MRHVGDGSLLDEIGLGQSGLRNDVCLHDSVDMHRQSRLVEVKLVAFTAERILLALNDVVLVADDFSPRRFSRSVAVFQLELACLVENESRCV